MEKWKCSKCNYIFVGNEQPEVCPHCGRRCEFKMFDDNAPPFTLLYDE